MQAMTDDDELEALRRRKRAELQAQAEQEHAQATQQEAARAQYEAQKASILRSILEPAAAERLTRVRIARPDVAASLEDQLVALVQQGRLRGKVNDELMRQFLARVAPKSRDIKIERK